MTAVSADAAEKEQLQLHVCPVAVELAVVDIRSSCPEHHSQCNH